MPEAKQKIYAAMQKIQAGLGAIAKDQKGHGYKFRGIDQVQNALHPLMKEAKVIVTRHNVEILSHKDVMVPKYDSYKKEMVDKRYIECVIQAIYRWVSLEDGSYIETEGFGEGQDNSGGDKALSMATSNSYKYVVFEMFNIATEEQKDSDQNTAITAQKEVKSSSKNTAAPAKKKPSEKALSALKGLVDKRGQKGVSKEEIANIDARIATAIEVYDLDMKQMQFIGLAE